MYSTVMSIFAGEYDIDYKKEQPVILDIGANIGGFAVWANERWANATIHSYEPSKSNFEWLQINTEKIPNINILNVAVGQQAEELKLFHGTGGNLCRASLRRGAEQVDYGESVRVIPASSLPKADIVKIDTEGWEVPILAAIEFQPDIYILEYHSIEDMNSIAEILANYTLVGHNITRPDLGVVKYSMVKKT